VTRVFLLAGQSNMSGRGDPGGVPAIADPRILVWRRGHAEPASEPLHDDPNAAVGLAMSFAATLLRDDPHDPVLLVPTAVGGTSIVRWLPGSGDLYGRAVDLMRAACTAGNAAGVLWHQGEADSGTETAAAAHADRLRTMIRGFRSGLGMPDLPFVAGGLGDFVVRYPGCPFADRVTAAIRAVCAEEPACAFVPAHALGHLGDDLHFDAGSLRRFGERYARAWRSLLTTRCPAPGR